MKKMWTLLLALTLVLGLSGCWAKPPAQPETPPPPPGSEGPSQPVEGEPGTLTLRLVDGAGTDTLLLAGEGKSEVYTLAVGEIPVLMDGGSADASVLEDGMELEITYNGTVLESFPGLLGGVTAISAPAEQPGGTYYDLCGLYLQVLNDLWDKDSGLNDGVEYISVDLSQAPGDLTEGEKAAIAWRFASDHQAKALQLTAEQLKEEGWLKEEPIDVDSAPTGETKTASSWENGLFFTITAGESGHTSLPVLRFDAMKWRSPLGAYWLEDCSCVWPEFGSWSGYQVGGEAIS